MYIIATIFLYELAEFFFSPFFSIASNLQSWKITHAEGTFLAVRFPRYFYRSSVWTGRTVVHPNKETRHSALHVHRYIFHFPFLFFSLFSPFTTISASSSSPSYLLSPFFSTTFDDGRRGSKLKLTIETRIFVRHSNSSANIYSICPSFSLSLGGHSTKVRHCHATTLFESSRARTGEKAKKEELVRLSVCLVIIVGSESWWILVPRVLFVYPYTMRHGKYFDETFFLSIRR